MAINFRLLLLTFLFIFDYELIRADRCCENGWAVSPNKKMCFKVSENSLNWFDADNYCNGQNGRLASIHDAFQNRWIWQLISSTNGNINNAWLGATTTHPAAGDVSGWYWHDGTPFDYINFAPGQPDNWQGCAQPDVGQQCLTMWVHNGDTSARWDDGCCHITLPFVCEKESSGFNCTPK